MRIRATIVAAVILLLALSIGAQAADPAQGSEWIYTPRAAGVTGTAAGDLNSCFSYIGAIGHSSGTLATSLGVPASQYGLYISSNTPAVGIRSATYTVTLPVDGNYEVFAAWGANTSAKNNAKHVITYNGGTANVLLDQVPAGNKSKWFSMGTNNYVTTTAAQVKLTNDNQSTSGSLYLGAVKYKLIAGKPKVATLTGPADGALHIPAIGAGNELSWTAGSYSSFFDIFLGITANPTTKVASDLAGTVATFDPDSLSLLPGTQYFWKVTAKNADMSTTSVIRSFTTEVVPEPSSILALGTGLIGLVGFARRRRG